MGMTNTLCTAASVRRMSHIVYGHTCDIPYLGVHLQGRSVHALFFSFLGGQAVSQCVIVIRMVVNMMLPNFLIQ